MPVIRREKVVPYNTSQMFILVNHVEDYPKFVPYCKSATILNQTSDDLEVKLEFAKGGLHKSFTTHNRLQLDKMVHVRLLDGPFSQLEGFWLFDSLPEGCRVCLDLEFEFSSKWMAVVFGPLFNTIANTLVDVFCQRAEEIYGNTRS